MFTKQHYEAIAKIIDDELNNPASLNLIHIAEALCELFATDNPNFDRKKFLTACGTHSFN